MVNFLVIYCTKKKRLRDVNILFCPPKIDIVQFDRVRGKDPLCLFTKVFDTLFRCARFAAFDMMGVTQRMQFVDSV